MTDYQLSNTVEYRARSHINIYDSPKCDRLATQMAAGRHLRAIDPPQHSLSKGGERLILGHSYRWLKMEKMQSSIGLLSRCNCAKMIIRDG
ncbi:MAG: hypothetical protein HC849_29670 [Oscillatoriales cyanobacterium RU_3_3]|nr:hypothetical protein [Oscillatoriales cyanobacterium RU_3_3]